jgi:hypothetical protein
MADTAAFGHHRTRGEQAYPKTAHQHRLGTVSEMIKLCDVYEALTAARPYKEAMPPIRAYRIMIGMADAFDRRLLRRFIEVIGAYPSGQLVELGTGEQARVIRQTADPFAPTVRVITDADGNPLDHDDQPTIELCDPACDSVRAIIRAATTDRFVTAEG